MNGSFGVGIGWGPDHEPRVILAIHGIDEQSAALVLVPEDAGRLAIALREAIDECADLESGTS